jgi:hypothetical protein
LAGDGDYRLIVADQEKRMKVYKGSFAVAAERGSAGRERSHACWAAVKSLSLLAFLAL